MTSKRTSTLTIEKRNTDAIRIVLVLCVILAITIAHYNTPTSSVLWHNFFQRLYYLPIVFAAIYFGWLGGLGAATCIAACYIPHIFIGWKAYPGYAMNQYAEIAVFFLVGFVTGLLADRERKRKRELEETAEQLSKVYAELQDSFEQLKRADRLSAIGHLSAGLAHEIRNPLAGIEGAVGILEQRELSEERRVEFLGIVKKECRRLNRLLTSLLDFARPRRPNYQIVDVGQILASVASLAVHMAAESAIPLRTDFPSSLPPIECDPEQLKQVILNLAINAIQAMTDGGEIILSARTKNSSILIQVKDQGCGISPEDVDKVFNPFFTTKENGTGLGLSMAHQIVSQHGGILSAERNPDKGMTFSVLLPRRQEGSV
ncbi:MAG: ATP-binding protein [Acidobacteriota bacterium]